MRPRAVIVGPSSPSHKGHVWVVISVFAPSECNTTANKFPESIDSCKITYTLDDLPPTFTSTEYISPFKLLEGITSVSAALWFSNGTQYGSLEHMDFNVLAEGVWLLLWDACSACKLLFHEFQDSCSESIQHWKASRTFPVRLSACIFCIHLNFRIDMCL